MIVRGGHCRPSTAPVFRALAVFARLTPACSRSGTGLPAPQAVKETPLARRVPRHPRFLTSTCSGSAEGSGAAGAPTACGVPLDCDNKDSSANDSCVEYCNGADENDSGIPDDFNCRNAPDADCSSGRICYTHSAYGRGISRPNDFGEVCPFVAAGSYCDAATFRCEF